MSATSTLLEALRAHYIGPEEFPGGVFLHEVQIPDEGTVRRADAVYLSFTRSRGIGIDVCELKVSRADFQAELDNPRKAEAWWPYSSRFWIVSPGPEVTPAELLPEGWGLMCPQSRGRRFKVLREPSARVPQVTLRLLVEIAKRMDTLKVEAVRKARQDERWEWQQKLTALQDERVERVSALTDDEKARLAAVAEVEKAAGVRLVAKGPAWSSEWSPELTPEQFGEAMRLAAGGVAARAEAQRKVRQLRMNLGGARGFLDAYEAELVKAEAAFGETNLAGVGAGRAE